MKNAPAPPSKTPPRIVVLGGGTGSFTLLQAFKRVTPHITAIVNMSDDGGSTGKLRDEYGVLPPGDARQCLVALSEATDELRELFSYRFGDGAGHGTLKGHSLGNLMLTAAALQSGSFEKGLEVLGDILRIRGTVVPVTLGNHTLVMQDGGDEIRGESAIGEHIIRSRDARVRLEPHATANPKALAAIMAADIVVIAPGNFFRSIIPVLAVDGIAAAFQSATATKIMVANLMTLPGHTDGWHVADFVRVAGRYLGDGTLDFALYNNSEPTAALMRKYATEGELPVAHGRAGFEGLTVPAIGAPLVAKDVVRQDPNDVLQRTLIRHDATAVAARIMRMWREHCLHLK